MIPKLHEHVDQFLERNAFANAALGLLSFGDRFERFWEGVVEGVGRAPERAVEPPREVFVVLGALRLSRHVRALLGRFAEEAPAVAEAPPSLARAAFRVPRRVLR